MFGRYAIYFVPGGALAAAGAAWLGWDICSGQAVRQPQTSVDLTSLTGTPRRYGFHATLKAPFRLADGRSARELEAATLSFAARQPVVSLADGLHVRQVGGFLALIPDPQPAPLTELAAAAVAELDAFRAPLSDAEIARRAPEGLSPQARENLLRWGYPHVMELFRFHMTLTGNADETTLDAAQNAAEAAFGPLLRGPLTIDSIALVGEDAQGCLHLIRRCALTG